MEELRLLLEKYLNRELVQMVISGPKKAQEEQKVRLRPVLLKEELKFQAEIFRGPKAFHENLEKDEAVEKILAWMAEDVGLLTRDNYMERLEKEREFYLNYDYDAIYQELEVD